MGPRRPDGGIGRRTSFRCWRSQGRGGSSPLLGTISFLSHYQDLDFCKIKAYALRLVQISGTKAATGNGIHRAGRYNAVVAGMDVSGTRKREGLSMLYRKLIFLIIIAFSASLSTQSAIAESIERILFNGRIFTANSEQPLAQAMAIKDGYIFAVGSNEEILTYKTANTELLDLQNKWGLPGLIDAHSHAIIGALAELSLICKMKWSI